MLCTDPLVARLRGTGILREVVLRVTKVNLLYDDKIVDFRQGSRSGLKGRSPNRLPLRAKPNLRPLDEDKEIKMDEPTQYLKDNFASIVGLLIYCSISCRPDLTTIVGPCYFT